MPGILQLQVQTFSLPKDGNAAEEYEDAAAADVGRGRFAIADGASESAFARRWAQLLAEGFVQAAVKQPGPWAAWLPPLQQCWAAEIEGRPLPWYAETKVEQGAFATFLGVVVTPANWPFGRRRWRAVAVGDSCLFQVRQGRLYRAFPVKRSQDFSTTPWLVGSRTPAARGLREREIWTSGDWCDGDRFWLMTDALAQWFLERDEGGFRPWESLEAVLADPVPAQAFAALVNDLRNAGGLRNDDVTLLAIGFGRET